MALELTQIQLGERYDRPALARLWGYAGFQALSRGVVFQKNNKNIVLFVTRIKQPSLTRYDDYISGDLLYWEGEKSHQSDERIITAAESGKTTHLFYREIHHTPFEYKGPVELVDVEHKLDLPSRFVFQLLHDQSANDDLALGRARPRLNAETVTAVRLQEATAALERERRSTEQG